MGEAELRASGRHCSKGAIRRRHMTCRFGANCIRPASQAQALVGDLLDHGGDALQARPGSAIDAVSDSAHLVTGDACRVVLRHAGCTQRVADVVPEAVETETLALQ